MRSADAATGEFSRDVARTGRALLLMIEDLVLWARLRAGTRVAAVHAASALIAPAVALHHSLAEHGGLKLMLEIPEGMRVETDLVLAQTLVRNLLANALKFARTRVILRAEESDAGVRFTVGNDGPPLPLEVAARLAAGEDEPMTATGGMGLRLCREICLAQGLRLEARSGVDGGTEFGFILKRIASAVEMENA
ncbi:MAG: ATP-binding protein [Chthoniobacteraceae bacterium]|nr:ATP-binding protein [Chthoniobacteraceae bacterium]